jgi:GNAT superfamily N-acetyltransferase
MDKAHLSRIVARLKGRGLLAARTSPDHGRHLLLSLTEAGQAAFADLERGARASMGALLEPLDEAARARLAAAMAEIETVLEARPEGEVRLRGLRPGDLGWIAHRQGVLYHQEYGWDWTYEGLVCEILGRFCANFDPAREDAWVAEVGGRTAGSVFLMAGDAPDTARLRLLYVEPFARGSGLGRRLVGVCIERARALGYRRLTLWTNDVLVAARRIYETAGFRLEEAAPHRSFGHDLHGQTWTLEL